MDGDGSAHNYRDAHRDLSGKHLFPSLYFEQAHRDQWIQIADMAAYAAYQAVLRSPSKMACWSWYEQYLSDIGPLSV